MNKYSCIILEDFSKPEDFNTLEDYYDYYWGYVLSYPLIMLPDNKIIFWGFETKLLKNEYDLLKSIIELNTNNINKSIFSEEEIIQNVSYHRCNYSIKKQKAIQRFITTSISRIKRNITNTVLDACVNMVEVYRFNPFIEGKLSQKKNFIMATGYRKDDNFKKQLITANINLTKIFTHMLNLTSPYNENYAHFVLKEAFNSLISSPKGQKQKAPNRFYKTDYIFSSKTFEIKEISNNRHRDKDELFSYAKITPTKVNIENFVNYPQF